MRQILILAPCAILAACGAADNDPGPGGVSVGEARALDEAAEMIEKRRLPQQEVAPIEEAEAQGPQDAKASTKP